MTPKPGMTVSNDRMAQFIAAITKQVSELLNSRSDDMLAAWHENIEEAQANQKLFPPLKISIAAAVNLEADTVESTIRFTATYTSTISEPLPEPDQMNLPI